MTNLQNSYNLIAQQGNFKADPLQRNAIKFLQEIKDIIERQKSIITKFQTPKKIKGIYLWGGVGRGKTVLLDIFYNNLQTDQKYRAHFHHFMKQLHQDLYETKGVENPLVKIALSMSKKYKVICFDEFFVEDITDAMLLGKLFTELFKNGVTLIATSNCMPDELYRNGLQRVNFLPAIEQIKLNCHIFNLDGGVDYRNMNIDVGNNYYYPRNDNALNSIFMLFKNRINQNHLIINGRKIPILGATDIALYLNFDALCNGPRSQHDYIEIAKLFNTIFISGVPKFLNNDDEARRFISAIDEFYSQKIHVIISADAPINELYSDGDLKLEFKRCESRLTEMQTEKYLN